MKKTNPTDTPEARLDANIRLFASTLSLSLQIAKPAFESCIAEVKWTAGTPSAAGIAAFVAADALAEFAERNAPAGSEMLGIYGELVAAFNTRLMARFGVAVSSAGEEPRQ